MDKATLKEIESIVHDLEKEARRHHQIAMTKNNKEAYMYWRGKRFAFADVRIKIDELINE